MHCPRCGQQQVSEETRFCSRCGFSLGLISEILAHGGVLPQLAELNNRKKKFWTRKNGIKIGLAWFLAVTFLLTPLAALADFEEGAAALAIIGFVGGLLTMLFSVIFLENEAKFYRTETEFQNLNYLGGKTPPNALPPQQSYPVQDFVPPSAGAWKAQKTGELVPHSVTDNTTKLLQKDE